MKEFLKGVGYFVAVCLISGITLVLVAIIFGKT